MGMIGLIVWVGLIKVISLKEIDIVFVLVVLGVVGSVVC